MADIEITDEASLEAWLKTRPRRDAEIIAFRAAARVFPLWGRAVEEPWAHRSTLDASKRDLTAMDYFRVLYTAYTLRGERNVTNKLSSNPASDSFTKFLLVDQPRLAIQSAYGFGECVYFNELRKHVGGQEINAGLVLGKAIGAFSSALEATTDLYLVSDIWAVDDVWSMDQLSRDLFAKQISMDCEKLSLDGKIDSSPLWPTPAPDWFTQADRETRAIWAKDPSTWAFWEKWWDGVISGDMPFSLDLLRDVALIEDDIWQAGPKAVAEAIAEIEAAHRETGADEEAPELPDGDIGYKVTPQTMLSAEILVKTAIANFTFDEILHLMRMVPFPDDIEFLNDPDQLARFLRASESMTKSIETMKMAFQKEGTAMQGAGGLATYLDAVLVELSSARQRNELNVGWVIECGDILQSYSLSAEVVAEIGPLSAPLRKAVQKLLELTRTYFASTLLRFAPLKDIRSREDTSLVALMEDLRRGLKVISSAPDDSRIGLAPEAIAVFDKLLVGVEQIIRAEFLAVDPVRKSSMRREVDFMMAQIAVSMALYWESGKRAVKVGYKGLAALGVLDQGQGALEKLVKFLRDLLNAGA